jgi:signal transduction histidine kinase
MTQKLPVGESVVQAPNFPYQEIARHVRNLLRCDYALVAVPDKDSIRIQAVAGDDPEPAVSLPSSLPTRLVDWGPVVVDDSRMIAVPVTLGNRALGVIVGYSCSPGTFTTADLEKLLNYANVAAGLMVSAAPSPGLTRTSFTPEELLHFSRLITIGELSACFAHEVNNPLTLIKGHLRFVQENLPPEHPLRINFEVIGRASLRIEEMAKRMLDFSKKRGHRVERCDMTEIVSDALRLVQPYIRLHLLDVRVHLGSELPLIDLDRWQMVQAIVNLVQNAADAMAQVERRVLSITAHVNGNRLVLEISDTGTGIAAADAERVFEPFFTTKGDRGTGLGLYITKQVVEEHKGSIQFETGAHGTTFVISLPL